MSKLAAKVTDPVNSLLVSTGLKATKVDKPADPGALPERGGPADPEIEKRVTEQFATRKQMIGAAAVAAGAQRSDNDADVLGFTAPKRRAASRTLLGGR